MDGVDHLFPAEYVDGFFNGEQNNEIAAPIDDEPLYVNAKQYLRILKRRVARARLEEVHRLSAQRKVSWNTLLTYRLTFRSPICTNLVINTRCDGQEALVADFSLQTRLRLRKQQKQDLPTKLNQKARSTSNILRQCNLHSHRRQSR